MADPTPLMTMRPARLFFLAFCALLAFAGNSLLCRLALTRTAIDPASFTLIRLAAGALMLWFIAQLRGPSTARAGSWPSAFALFAYAAAFSFAYLTLSAGTGALLLFGAVQATMILWGMVKGERLDGRQILGLSLALGGLVLLVFPGLSAPPLAGSVLMLAAGAAWGVYSLRGKSAGDPVSATAGNFLRAVPFAAIFGLALLPSAHVDWSGIIYAVLSGALASGIGYLIWYSVLPELKVTTAASLQLSVPVLTAALGVVLLGEAFTLRLLAAALAILGGIALVVVGQSQRA